MIADWKWKHDGVLRREIDFLVDVDGDLPAPRLEPGKHDASAWVGLGNLDLMMQGCSDGDRRLWGIVAKAVRIRLTDRLRLDPIRPEYAEDIWRLHQDNAVAAWHGGQWSVETAHRETQRYGQAWETRRVHTWMAYDRITGALVGRGGLSRMHVDDQPRLEIGWTTVRENLWGHGYATEIGRAGLCVRLRRAGRSSPRLRRNGGATRSSGSTDTS